MSRILASCLLFAGLCVALVAAGPTGAEQRQDPASDKTTDPPAADPNDPRSTARRKEVLGSDEMREALQWVRQHVRASLVHDEEDLKKLEARLRRMPVDELQKFLVDLREYRQLVESEEWQEMRSWMKEFLRVQARVSDKELEKFRHEVSRMNVDELRELLVEFQMERSARRGQHAAETAARQRQVQSSLAQRPQLPATGARGVPQFGGGSPPDAIRTAQRPLRAPEPTITAGDYARRSLFRSVFGRRW